MGRRRQADPDKLDGQALTQELFSDVYMAGTSDGVQQLAQGEIRVEAKPYDEEAGSERKP